MNLEITKFVSSQREQAFLVGDYGTYRKKLSRRLLVVRRKLGYATKGRKYATKTPITIKNIEENVEYAHLLLLSAERAWAQAMQVKTTRPTESSRQGLQGSTRKHIISRLRRAISYAQRLSLLVQEAQSEHSDSDDVLEVLAYAQSLSGLIYFEKNQWQRAMQDLSEARFFYAYFARRQGGKGSSHFTEMISSYLDPNIRYAAYQAGLPRTTSIDAISYRCVSENRTDHINEVLRRDPDALKDPTRKAVSGDRKNIPKTISWRTRTVTIEDAGTAQALGAVSDAEANLTSFFSSNPDATLHLKAAEYDQVLIPSQDAVDATKTAIEELTVEGIGQSDPRMQALQITRTAVNFALIKWRIGRNRVLCGSHDGSSFEPVTRARRKLRASEGQIPKFAGEESAGQQIKRLKERVVLYDAIIQSLDGVKELPGVAADQIFLREMEEKRAYFAALRCLAIARSHSVFGNLRESLALLSRALELSASAPKQASSTDPSSNKPLNIDITAEQTSYLHELLQGMVIQYRGMVELHNIDATTKRTAANTFSRPLVERLSEYPAGNLDLTKLVKYPPKLEPIPVKPIFLDLAYNYIDYPGRIQKNGDAAVNGTLEQAASKEEKKESKKGWFGFGR